MTDTDNGHVWHERVFASMQVQCCMNCGFTKNEDQPNKPCPGPVRVELRNPAPQPNVLLPIERLADLIDDAAPGILRPDTRLRIASHIRAVLASKEPGQ